MDISEWTPSTLPEDNLKSDAIKLLWNKHGWTIEEIAKTVSKSKTYVKDVLRKRKGD